MGRRTTAVPSAGQEVHPLKMSIGSYQLTYDGAVVISIAMERIFCLVREHTRLKAMQVARHRRCLVLRRTPGRVWLSQEKHRSSPREARTPIHATRQKRDEAGAQPPVTLPTLDTRVARQV